MLDCRLKRQFTVSHNNLGPAAETVADWATGLEEVVQRIGPHFASIPTVERVWSYLQGLLCQDRQQATEAKQAT